MFTERNLILNSFYFTVVNYTKDEGFTILTNLRILIFIKKTPFKNVTTWYSKDYWKNIYRILNIKIKTLAYV